MISSINLIELSPTLLFYTFQNPLHVDRNIVKNEPEKEEQEKERRKKNRIRNKVVRKYISPDRRLSIERVRVKFNTNFLSAKCKVNGARWIKGGTENKIEKNLLVVPIVYHGERERSREDTDGLTASDT